MTEDSVASIFRIQSQYTARNFRRREDSREIPNAITVGLKHGAALRNSLLTDTGLNELLDKEFLAYNDQTDFNDLPIPFRCQATDLNAREDRHLRPRLAAGCGPRLRLHPRRLPPV